GGIAAYKTPALVRLLTGQGHSVSVIFTASAHQFVSAAVMGTLSGSPVLDQVVPTDGTIPHLSLNRNHDVMVIAPATANSISKFACGLADDLVSATFLTFQGPRIVVPAMHTEMLEAPVIQAHLSLLRMWGVSILGPDVGVLACEDVGPGRMVEPELIALRVQAVGSDLPDLTGKTVVVTAGGTVEPLDPVRVITNRSTGQLGHTIAHLAAFAGATVRLVSTVLPLSNPAFDSVECVQTVAQMQAALVRTMPGADALVMAAAVSDFTAKASEQKSKRGSLTAIPVQPTLDLVVEMGVQFPSARRIGFCLEDQDPIRVGREKLARKGLHAIVVNSSATIGKARRSVEILRDGSDAVASLRDQPVTAVAAAVLRELL
ncbi:MAG: bifunctional phosphopantothenoylcysteine decarboxylase/phosphopantothenate--cysteine ligase CoaBC, partial [Candidatus Margulisiibacteriota bacterium]